MYKRLYELLENKNILYKTKFGFRKINSTIFALSQNTEKIRETIDLRKAFDTVNHQILLQKLEHYGRGSALNWFESHLENRKQYVYLNGESSDLEKISWSPSGLCARPLLFLLYINDLPNISKILDFYLIADVP